MSETSKGRRVFLYIAYYLGLRRGEIMGLTWGQVAVETLEVQILASTSKSRSQRVVPIAPELADVLNEWRNKQSEADGKSRVLPWPYDNYRNMYDDWHMIQNAAGIPEGQHYVPKNCRSTVCLGVDSSQCAHSCGQGFLGHASVATTENYYINTKPALRAAANARKVRLENGEPTKLDEPKGCESAEAKNGSVEEL